MSIFDQAMELEQEGESLYRQFSLEAPNKGMRNIFIWLADKEREHYEVFKKLKGGMPVSVPPNTLLRDVKEIFEDWKESSVCLEVKTSLVDIYRKALGIEVKSISVYEKYATSAVTSQKKVFLRIAAEEKGHKCIMENIIEFLTRPESWVENAEFSHLDEDYYL